MTMESSLFNWNFQSFVISDDFFAIANFALIRNRLALSVTVFTLGLDLLIHAWTHLVHLNDLTFALTVRTGLYSCTSLALTGLAIASPFVVNFDHASRVYLL